MARKVWAVIGAVALVIAGMVSPAEASPAAYLRCWVITPTELNGGKWLVRIGSTRPNTAKVHAITVKWHKKNTLTVAYRTVRYSPISNRYITPAMKGWEINHVAAGQSGTYCTEYAR